ncbi:O-antigen ligase family protein [Phenylobacterium sp.]|uniref:O-antigen ligase family protein n=1 Tax=Phenylobacterium sp. TaxID=1871053 RepID=UPI0035B166AF
MTHTPDESLHWSGFSFMRTRQAQWLIMFAICTSLLFIAMLQTIGALIMLAAGAAYFLSLPQSLMLRVAKATPVLAYPILALASTLWSEAPAITFRLSLQFLLTAGLAVVIYRTVPLRTFISALFAAAFMACGVGVILGAQGIAAGHALAGVAESKNMMAFIASVLVLSSLAITLDSAFPRIFKPAAIGGIAFGVLVLFLAQSAGAYIGTFLGGIAMIAVRFYQSAPRSVRVVVLAGALLLVPVGLMAQSILASEASEFSEDVLGKDSTLTGRTYLWQRAGQYIAEKPIAGHGYGAFWRQGSLEAEGLWRMYGIPGRSGFNFHNQYLEAGVDLGYAGIITFVLMNLATLAALGVRLLRTQSSELPFIAGVYMALLVRTPVESVMLTQFSILATLLFLTVCGALYGNETGPVLARASARTKAGLTRQRVSRGLVQQRVTPAATAEERRKDFVQFRPEAGLTQQGVGPSARPRRNLRQSKPRPARQRRPTDTP